LQEQAWQLDGRNKNRDNDIVIILLAAFFAGGCLENVIGTNPKTGLFEANVIVGPLSLSNPVKFRMRKKQKSVLPERSRFILKFSILFLAPSP
jgi:hypothetical protein